MFYSVIILVILLPYSYETSLIECNLSDDIIKEIQSYKPIVDKIIETTTNETFKGRTYELLAEWVDTFGSRLVGTKNLENSIDYLVKMMDQNNITKIYTENATVPHWER